MKEKCIECFYYKEKNKLIGFCSLQTKLKKPDQTCSEFKIKEEKHKIKITIRNGIKYYS